MDEDIPYLLLTPGPLTTSPSVKRVMMQDFCTWDDHYNSIVTQVRDELLRIAGVSAPDYTSVLMQGSGTFSVEATLGTAVPHDGKLLIASNGAYGRRVKQIADRLSIAAVEVPFPETEPVDPARIEAALDADPAITHVAMVHCETTTGLLNPAADVGRIARDREKTYILDAMSSFGGIPMQLDDVGAEFLISSANKCIQGVPGFGFIIACTEALTACEGRARSLSLDLYDQWREMEAHDGKWRFTSPTHTVRAFRQALGELEDEGGVPARHARYCENARRLVDGMERIGFRPLLPAERRSPIITSFRYPDDPSFKFDVFYDALKRRRFVIYPGKVSDAPTFRIGTIGHVFPTDIDDLIAAVRETVAELRLRLR